MQFFSKSLVATAIVSLLAACGGGSDGGSGAPANGGDLGGGKPNPTLQITGLVAESNFKKSKLEVRLVSEGEVVATSYPTVKVDEFQPRYFIPLTDEVGAGPFTLHAVAVPFTYQELTGSDEPGDINDLDKEYYANYLKEERLLFSTEIGSLESIKSADLDKDNFVTHDEHLHLTLSATNTLLSILDENSDKSSVEIMQEQDRQRVMAILAVIHSVYDPFDPEKQAVVPDFDLDVRSFTEKLLAESELELVELTEEQTWQDKAKQAYINLSKKLFVYEPEQPDVTDGEAETAAEVLARNTPSSTDSEQPEEPEVDPLAELEAKWLERIGKKWVEMHAVKQTNIVREVLDTSYPPKQLTFRGEIVNGLGDPYVSLQIGSYPNDPLANTHYDNPLKPKRPAIVPLYTKEEQLPYSRLTVDGNTFEFTVSLPDTAQSFDLCKPTGLGVYVYKDIDSDLTKPSKHPTDNMQDLLTVVVEDDASGVEMRSFLGAFCELAKPEIDKNQDGIVDTTELPRLKVSFENAAHVLLAERSNLQHHGGAQLAKPVSQEAISELLAKHSADEEGNPNTDLLELMSTIMAMQVASYTDPSIPAIDNAADFFKTAAQLLGLDYNATYRMYGKSNVLPQPFEVIAALKNISDVAHGMFDNNVTINVLLKQAASALANQSQFSEDKAIADTIVKAIAAETSWLPPEPIDGLESVCSTEFADDQIRGIYVRGQGDDWLTFEWQTSASSEYQLFWNESKLDDMSKSANKLTTDTNRVTVRGLDNFKDYHFQIAHSGTPSAVFSIYKGGAGLVNSAKYDNDFSCDTMTGLARNSNLDGYKALSFLKVDQAGDALERQDLPYQVLPHSCAVDTKTGTTWGIPNAVMEDGDRVRHWFGLDNRYVHGSDVQVPDDKFNGFCVNTDGSVFTENRAANCNTEAIVQRANEAKYCGVENWRLPTFEDYAKVMTFSGDPVYHFDDAFFPSLDSNRLWVNQANPSQPTHAYQIFPVGWGIRAELEGRNVPNMLILVSDGLQVPAK